MLSRGRGGQREMCGTSLPQYLTCSPLNRKGRGKRAVGSCCFPNYFRFYHLFPLRTSARGPSSLPLAPHPTPTGHTAAQRFAVAADEKFSSFFFLWRLLPHSEQACEGLQCNQVNSFALASMSRVAAAFVYTYLCYFNFQSSARTGQMQSRRRGGELDL